MFRALPAPHARRAGLACLGLLALLPAAALAQTLTIGLANPVNSFDPHFANTTSNFALTGHVFDTLIGRDADARLIPALAASWVVVEPTVWEFRLRPGVTWQDGQPFTADDVAFTVARVPHVQGSPGGFAGAVRAITRVEVVDAGTVRFHSAQPSPLLPNDLASVQIISRHAGTDANPPDYNRGSAAIGTGPYRFAGYRPGEGASFTRNDAWWGPAQPWARVNFRFIANDGARTAALLAGDVDLIDQVPGADLPRLRRETRLTIAETTGVRLIYLQPDFSREGGDVPGVTDNNGQRLPRNPFHDLRIRRALSIAIDRRALAERIMHGAAIPTGQWLPEGSYSYNPEVGVPPYDPAEARRLLAEAGYPQGFGLTLQCTADRFAGDARTCQAVGQMLGAIGIRTAVETLPTAIFFRRAGTGYCNDPDFSASMSMFASTTGLASESMNTLLRTPNGALGHGASNRGRYSDAVLDGLLAGIETTIDDAARESLTRQAVRRVMAEAPVVPVFFVRSAWGTRRGFSLTPRGDQYTMATGIRLQP